MQTQPATQTYTEAEAAEYLRLNVHVLRDERQRGRIGFRRIVKGRVRYTQADLDDYLERSKVDPTEASQSA